MPASPGEAGVKSTLGDGRVAGILTDGATGGANVVGLHPERLIEALEHTDVLVLPGGQGYYDHECSWLGKNSSDYSAVLIAGMLELEEVYIHSDVSHVFDKDPNNYPDAKPLKRVGYPTLITAGQYGAKVLHPKAVKEAMVRKVRIRTALNEPPFTLGTVIDDREAEVCITVTDKYAKLFTFTDMQNSRQAKIRLEGSQFFPLDCEEVTGLKENQLLVPACYLNPAEHLDDFLRPLEISDAVFEHEISNKGINSRLLSSRNDTHVSTCSAVL